jgi:2-keto-4-pentenoate hydratase
MTFDVERNAALLLEARAQHRQIVPPAPAPSSPDEAYAVQDAVIAQQGSIGAWKVGAKAVGQTPNAAPIPSQLVRQAPCEWPASSLHMIGIEAELAFRLGCDVAPRRERVLPEEVWAAVASVHTAIEIVDTRLADWKNADRLWVLADSQSNGGFVYDPEGVPLSSVSFDEPAARLSIDGRVAIERRGGNPAGDPRWLVEWLVDHCARRRNGLRAGMLLTTGSYTGMAFVEPGTSVQASFEGIGAVELRFP